MKIRLGYVALSKNFDCLFRTTTYTSFKENRNFSHLEEIIIHNLHSLTELLKYNQKNNIHFYRITSNLIPLATHQDVSFSYIKPYQNLYDQIGQYIQQNNMRCDMHPDQFAVLNSTRKEVTENTTRILEYHLDLLEAMHIQNPTLILHVGSSVFGKEKSLQRFIYQFKKLPKRIQGAIALENDDKIYNVKDVLYLCETLDIRMILDYHHYICNKGEIDIKDYYKRIFDTWKGQTPKIHFSSPKNKTKKEMRSHHDYIDSDAFIHFLESVKDLPYDLDIMIEAKMKDDALFRLTRDLKYKTEYTFIDDTSFYI